MANTVLLATIFSATLFLVTLGDSRGMGSLSGKQCNKWIETFFKMPPSEQIRKFGSYTIEDQYSIYICGNQVFHPPAIYLSRPFAMEGKAAVDFLRTKLLQTKDDLTICDIVFVLSEMNRHKAYNVARDGGLMKIINDRVDGMESDDWKRITKKMVAEINGI